MPDKKKCDVCGESLILMMEVDWPSTWVCTNPYCPSNRPKPMPPMERIWMPGPEPSVPVVNLDDAADDEAICMKMQQALKLLLECQEGLEKSSIQIASSSNILLRETIEKLNMIMKSFARGINFDREFKKMRGSK